MSKPSRELIVQALPQRHGRTYAAELGIDLERNTPSVLYRWLCAATLLSARIGATIAMQAARALEAGARLGLEDDAERLARRVSRKDYPRLLAALVRTGLANDFDAVLAAASR